MLSVVVSDMVALGALSGMVVAAAVSPGAFACRLSWTGLSLTTNSGEGEATASAVVFVPSCSLLCGLLVNSVLDIDG
jgi:hypothetical protein